MRDRSRYKWRWFSIKGNLLITYEIPTMSRRKISYFSASDDSESLNQRPPGTGQRWKDVSM